MPSPTAPSPDAAAARAPRYSWYALAVLTTVYILNFLDRTLIYLLFTPIKAEMHFSDLQLAMLGTTSFVVFYTVLGIPFGRLADRVSRKNMIAAGLAIWSLFSGLTGLADSFWTMFFCRMMVGVGEATLGPAALSLLSDYFPPRMRGTVQSIYSSGIAIGGGLAFLLGGWIAQLQGWRSAFFIVGFPGLIVAVLVFLLREEPRGVREAAAARPTTDWSPLRSAPFLFLCAGYAFVGLASNNIGVWLPAFFVRVHKVSLPMIGTAGFLLSICVGVPAMIMAGWLSDRAGRVLRGGRMAFTAVAAIASVPLWLALLFVDSLPMVVVVNVVLYALAIMWVGPATADVSDLAGPHLRGIAIGIFFSSVNFAYLIGSNLIGKLSDILSVATHAEQMRYSLLVCPVACALGALLLWMGSRARARAA
jgi:MFS family permease